MTKANEDEQFIPEMLTFISWNYAKIIYLNRILAYFKLILIEFKIHLSQNKLGDYDLNSPQLTNVKNRSVPKCWWTSIISICKYWTRKKKHHPEREKTTYPQLTTSEVQDSL